MVLFINAISSTYSIGLATFIGPPIMGALLGSSNYKWYKPSLFSGVRPLPVLH